MWRGHGEYPQADDWAKIEQWYLAHVPRQASPNAMERLRRKVVGRLRRMLGIHAIPAWHCAPRAPGKPPRTYRVSTRRRVRMFDPACPLWQRTPDTARASEDSLDGAVAWLETNPSANH